MKVPLAFVLLSFLATPLFAETAGVPDNVGGGLDRLVEWHRAHAADKADRGGRVKKDAPLAAAGKVDAQVETAVVNVRLDGGQPLASVQQALEALGATVLGSHATPTGKGSVISARLPVAKVTEASAVPGVFSITLAHKPIRRVGSTTSEGAALLKSTTLNTQGLMGQGITVGVLSDSFDVSFPPASDDVTSGDLPGPGNSVNPTPVTVLVEGDPASDDDEGRAMLQIIHDVAPKAKLVFTSVGSTAAVFAQRLRDMRAALCDILVDDIGFADEPMFSDGIAAQAVEDVVRSSSLPGKKVFYYSAAGNDGDSGLVDDFRLVPEADVLSRSLPNNLKLNQVPAFLTDGGFHNFARTGSPVITQHVKSTGGQAFINFQWDDAFLPGAITTDYNLLVFDARGNFRPDLSGIDYNFNLGQAVEFALIPNSKTGYQIAITRRNIGAKTAVHLRYVVSAEGNYESDFLPRGAATLFGHVGAPGSDAVAAYNALDPTSPEPFSSFGPLTIYFDRNGNRLAMPEVRQQPSLAGPDNVNTTFFPDSFSDADGDSFPNFPGTSAAAPHIAGVAALLLEAAGGPGSVTETAMRSALRLSAGVHDLDPNFCQATATTGEGATAKLTATGGDDDRASSDAKFFHLELTAPAGISLQKVTIDLAAAGLRFDTSAKLGFPFKLGAFTGGVKRSQVKAKVSGTGKSLLTLTFSGKTFLNAATIDFGVDRDDATLKSGGNSADLLGGATFGITTQNGAISTASGTFTNVENAGFSPFDGYGFVDAVEARDVLVP